MVITRQRLYEITKNMKKDEMRKRLLDEYETIQNELHNIASNYYDLRDAVIDKAWNEATELVKGEVTKNDNGRI